MNLSVIILNYNVRYFLELCLHSVQGALENINSEIIVVDNDSSDDSCKMVEEEFPNVVLVKNSNNSGFSKGNNIGVSKAKGEYVCILNPDTVVPEDVFERLLTFARKKNKLGVLGCRLINGAGEFLPESKRNVPTIDVAFKKLFGNSSKYYANHINEIDTGKVDILVGAIMLLKRSVYKEIKGFDEDYFMYGEDIDLSYRLIKKGYENFYFGESTIVHFKGESTLRDKLYAKRFYGAMQTFYKKHFKKNVLFDFIVWLGIVFAYWVRGSSKNNLKILNKYLIITNKSHPKLEIKLDNPLEVKNNINEISDNVGVIFDTSYLSFKQIICDILNLKKTKKEITFKFLVKKGNFVVGSDSTISQGKVIKF